MAKKKTQLKKPVRGFATTSIAKKKDPALEQAAEEQPTQPKVQTDDVENGVATPLADAAAPSGIVQPKEEEEEEWGPEQIETQYLQSLAERIRPLADKEVSKLMKSYEYEQRLATSLPAFSWGEDFRFRDEILKAAWEEEDHFQSPAPNTQDSADKVLARTIAFYTILTRIGFSSDSAISCLTTVKHLDWEELTAWLVLRCPDDQLRFEITSEAKYRPNSVAVEDLPAQPITSPPQVRSHSRTPSSTRRPSSDILVSPMNGSGATPKANNSISSHWLYGESSSDSEVDEDDPDGSFVKIKVKITLLERKIKSAVKYQKQTADLDRKMRSLREKMSRVEGDPLLDKRAATAAFTAALAKKDEADLTAKLSKLSAAGPTSPDISKHPRHMRRQSSFSLDTSIANSTTSATPAEADTTDGDILGGLFAETASTAQESVSTEDGSRIVRDMALPKHWSGSMPRAILEQTVRRMDKFGKVTFFLDSKSTPRASKVFVSIRWESGKVEAWGMGEEYCSNEQQAQHYVATCALFAISTTPIHRQLPASYKELWDELDQKCKSEEEATYRNQLRLLEPIAAYRAASADTSVIKKSADGNPSQTYEVNAITADFAHYRGQHNLAEDIGRRQQSPAYQEMLPYRNNLPIAAYKAHILDAISKSQILVLCGETGCGKSTQVPSFILEHELSQNRPVKIYCTEPRRISAISLAQRVSQELGEQHCGARNSLVGYAVRLENKISASTRLVYATTGIVLRMMEGDEQFNDITHILIDEVHERSIESDFLLIILKKLLLQRKSLKVILMSATVDAEKIATYMGGAPVITVPGRTFPVNALYLEDIIELCQYKLDAYTDSPYVHRNARRNPGERLSRRPSQVPDDDDADEDENPIGSSDLSRYSKGTQTTLEVMDQALINFDLIVNLLEQICFLNADLANNFSKAILIFMPSFEAIRKLNDLLEAHPDFGTTAFSIFPLHSAISTENQGKVFELPPPGIRKIVIATNIAETGITIPDVTCVIDSGKHKEMRFDEKRQISRLIETYIAKSNAAQRRGRAGRVQEGVAFALFTREQATTRMAEHPQPEMLRLSLQDLALRIKIMSTHFTGSIEDTLLQAMDPPVIINIQRAIASLIEVKALTPSEEITTLGRHLVKLPMDVHMAKFLLLACMHSVLDPALTIAAVLNSKTPFAAPFNRQSEADTIKRSFKMDVPSDFLTVYNAYSKWKEACMTGHHWDFCRKNFLSHNTLIQVEDLKLQFMTNLTDAGFVQTGNDSAYRIPKIGKTRFVQVPGYLNAHAKDSTLIMSTLAAAMHPKTLQVDDATGQLKMHSNSAIASVHPSSVNFGSGKRPFGDAKYVTYFQILQSKKLYVRESGAVDEKAFMLLCGDADFKLAATSVSIDRKVRMKVDPKTALSLKILRNKAQQLFDAKMKQPNLKWSSKQEKWMQLILKAISSEEKEETEIEKIAKAPVSISIHRH